MKLTLCRRCKKMLSDGPTFYDTAYLSDWLAGLYPVPIEHEKLAWAFCLTCYKKSSVI